MMGKENRQIIALFTILLVGLNFFTEGSATESEKNLARRKRNVICFFGLNGLISEMFYEALIDIQKYDPVPIGSLLNGKFQNGEFKGLSSLRNKSAINVDCDGDLVVISTVLDVSGASISYQWEKKMLKTFRGSVWTKVKDIQFTLEMTLNMTRGIELDVTNLKLTRMEGLKFGFKGLGPLNPLIKVLGTVVLNVWEHKISQKIEELLRNALESELCQFRISF